jgi:c-di-GMP-binding flagellar brake protein YcgR
MDDAQLTVEKRRFPRVAVSLNVRFKVINNTPEAESLAKGREALASQSTNVSKGGVALYTEYKLAKGDLVKVELVLPGSTKPVKAFAEVKWCQAAREGGKDGGFRAGILFMALRREDEERLEVFLNKLSEVG